ncbi:MAG: hypothetical protein C6I00_02420 [Nitratiruptor sp.]|nr:hypothetical protein [Nitratiruptor sp.]NPA84140.1 methyltransferase domain-containing protein [Campylobacterota bacterium]
MQGCIERVAKVIYERSGVTFKGKWQLFQIRFLEACEELGIFSCEEFYHRIAHPNHFYDLLSYFMVSQSYFYREARHFEILLELIEREEIQEPQILSIPCAQGEEPYSIAMALDHRGIEGYHIDAIDINPKAIEKAKEGRYSPREVFPIPSTILARYFDFDGHSYQIDPKVGRSITFQVGNLFELEGPGSYDFLFCRNLMIYLDWSKRQEALAIFHRLLRPGGYLILSFSDYIPKIEGFETITIHNKEIYQKR